MYYHFIYCGTKFISRKCQDPGKGGGEGVLPFITCLEKYSQPETRIAVAYSGMQQVLFHSTFPLLLAYNKLLGSF